MPSELRHDPLTGTWVLICEEREKRPRGDSGGIKKCPFCPGNEDLTTPTILSLPTSNDARNWQTRVFPNKFKALSIEPQLERMGVGVYLKDNGVGAHEVIVEHPHDDHRRPTELKKDEWVCILSTAQMRMQDLVKDKRLKYPVLFKNHGEAAGASIAHPHWQLMALPIVPPRIERTLNACKEYYGRNKHCLMCRIINDEINSGERVIWQNNSIIAWSSYTSRFPYEFLISPKPEFHSHGFEKENAERLGEIAESFMEMLRRLSAAAGDPDFNIVLFTSPWFENEPRQNSGTTIERDFHWHFQVIPRLTKMAGFEWGTGFYINQKSPELAAKELREISL